MSRDPTVGGLCIYPAFLVGMMLQIELAEAYRVLLVSMGFLAIVGALDDALDLSAAKKMIAQLIAATLIIVASNLPPFLIGNPPTVDPWTMLASVLLTLFLILWIINAVNMIDGFDGRRRRARGGRADVVGHRIDTHRDLTTWPPSSSDWLFRLSRSWYSIIVPRGGNALPCSWAMPEP